ncbi:MAG: hypothetical protein ABIV21_05595 [Pyrinomonadaceae bacterium]
MLKENDVEYLLVGGYAVSFYGYPRPTGDIDIWVSRGIENAYKLVAILGTFGFSSPDLIPDLFTLPKSVVRMGVEPFKLEILTDIDGVQFDQCFSKRNLAVIDGVEISVIDLEDLKTNKKASGRLKDLNDLENLA